MGPAREDVAASIYFERTFNYLRVSVVGGFVEVTGMREDGSLIQAVSWGSLPERLVAKAPSREPRAAAPVPVAATVPVTSAGAQAAGCAVGGAGQGGAGWIVALMLLGLRRRSRLH